jgi:hypothetical protein
LPDRGEASLKINAKVRDCSCVVSGSRDGCENYSEIGFHVRIAPMAKDLLIFFTILIRLRFLVTRAFFAPFP